MYDSVLFIGGAPPPSYAIDVINTRSVFVAAADSGVDLAHASGMTPDLICGDMDSIANPGLLEYFSHAERAEFNAAKDETDTEIGLRLLRERGYTKTVVCGGGADGRPDHYMGIVWTFEKPVAPIAWLERDGEVCNVDEGETLRFEADKGTILSCFPVAAGPYSFSSTGLRWPLEGMRWSRDTAGLGISNEVVDSRASVQCHAGRLLVVRPFVVDGLRNGRSLMTGSWQR